MTDLRIELDDLTRLAVVTFMEGHLQEMYEVSPPESVHALDLEALRAPGIRFWSAWWDEELVGTVALKDLDAGDVELKSMRVSAAVRGGGVGRGLLAHALNQARTDGTQRVLLETGAEPYFAAARSLYLSAGFRICSPFAAYVPDPNSVFMELVLV